MPIKPRANSQVEKYRKKLEASITEEKKLFNIAAIEKAKSTIHAWLDAHANERIDLTLRSINLSDAPNSKFILKLMSQIKAGKNIPVQRKFKANKIHG